MTDPVSLLPPASTPFEQAAETTGSVRIAALDPTVIKTMVDPYAIPDAILPWLAWGIGCDVWSDDWPIERKRWVVATEISRKRLKGTLAGVRGYLNLVDSDIVAAITPPGKTYLSPAITPEQRAAYLALFAQLRVLPYVASATNRYAAFGGCAYGLGKAFVGKTYPHWLGSTERYTRTAEIVDVDGTTTVLTLRTVTEEDVGSISATTYDEIALPAVASTKIFPGAPPKAKMFFGLPFDPSSIIRVPVTETFSFAEARVTETTVTAGLALIDVIPDDVAEPHVALKRQPFPGASFFNGLSLPASVAWRYIYQRWYVFDPSRVPASRKASTFLNWTRLGIQPYTAELQVDIQGVAGPAEVWRFVRGCLRPKSETPQQIANALYAINVSKSSRDQILVKTKTKRPPQPSDLLQVGSIALGQWVRAEP